MEMRWISSWDLGGDSHRMWSMAGPRLRSGVGSTSPSDGGFFGRWCRGTCSVGKMKCNVEGATPLQQQQPVGTKVRFFVRKPSHAFHKVPSGE